MQYVLSDCYRNGLMPDGNNGLEAYWPVAFNQTEKKIHALCKMPQRLIHKNLVQMIAPKILDELTKSFRLISA